jgi:hypothetical protein
VAKCFGSRIFGGSEFSRHSKGRTPRRSPIPREQLSNRSAVASCGTFYQISLCVFAHVMEYVRDI